MRTLCDCGLHVCVLILCENVKYIQYTIVASKLVCSKKEEQKQGKIAEKWRSGTVWRSVEKWDKGKGQNRGNKEGSTQKINKINKINKTEIQELNMNENVLPDIQTKWWRAGGRDWGKAKGLTVPHTSPTCCPHKPTHTRTHFLYCAANCWKMIFCVWCSSSKSSIELQLLSFTQVAVLPLRMENEPRKVLITLQSPWHSQRKVVVWVYVE